MKNKSTDVRASCELLPCPYCGRAARYVAEDYVDNSGEPWPFAECDACNTGAPVEFWNKRVQPADQQGEPVALTVWYGPMPESNGKSNFTAILHRKGSCMSEGICIDRSEYPERTRYEADRMLFLIGEREEEPDILAYDADAHSGYVRPVQPAQPSTAKMDERLVEVTAFVQKLRDAAAGQPTVASGYLSDILDVLRGCDKLNTPH